VHLGICVSYVEYIEHTTGDNASTTQRKAHAGYINDTRFSTEDKCRIGRMQLSSTEPVEGGIRQNSGDRRANNLSLVIPRALGMPRADDRHWEGPHGSTGLPAPIPHPRLDRGYTAITGGARAI
jgi:hypothetical protein